MYCTRHSRRGRLWARVGKINVTFLDFTFCLYTEVSDEEEGNTQYDLYKL